MDIWENTKGMNFFFLFWQAWVLSAILQFPGPCVTINSSTLVLLESVYILFCFYQQKMIRLRLISATSRIYGLEELALEKCSLAIPSSITQKNALSMELETFEGKQQVELASKKRSRSLLVTIENYTPKIKLAQSLRTRALLKILLFPKEETVSYKSWMWPKLQW